MQGTLFSGPVSSTPSRDRVVAQFAENTLGAQKAAIHIQPRQPLLFWPI
jgi:hypothetical protein